MKIIILAAGRGSRLGLSTPKLLTPLFKNNNILDFLLKRLHSIAKPKDISIVVGYKRNIIKCKYPSLNYVVNSRYEKTNTAKSLLLAIKNFTGDVLWINGDIYIDEGVIEKLVHSSVSSCLVNSQKCANEEIKYNLYNDGYVKELSKDVLNAKGEALGINLIKKEDLENFKKELKRVKDMDYFEKALENLTLNKTLKLKPIVISQFCCEMDFIKDVKKVQNYLKKRQKDV